MSEPLELTQNLMARRSVTPADEGCQQVLTERLAALGFAIEPLPFGNVENFWARHGNSAPVLCFAGHTDVVPTGPLEEWRTDPLDRKSTRLNSSHSQISYAVFCLKK